MSKFKFSDQDLKRLAELMKLELSKKEHKQFKHELPETLDIVANLNELETSQIQPTYQTTGLVNRFQTEKIDERRLTTKAIFQNTTKTKNHCFQIKSIKYAK